MRKHFGKSKVGILSKIIFIIALIVLIFSGYKLFMIWSEYNDNSKVYEEAREYSPNLITKEDGKSKFVFDPVDFQKLFDINNDIKAWIKIPNTNVDYPVVQCDDNQYYLKHNFYKQVNSGGCIFIASENKNPLEEKNTIFHGHHMRDGSMFESLTNFKMEDFFKDNSKIYVATKDNVFEYDIFSVYVITANKEPYQYSFASDEKYISFLNGLSSKSFYKRDVGEFTKDDKIITLSTCTYEVDDGRLLIHAKLLNKEAQ